MPKHVSGSHHMGFAGVSRPLRAKVLGKRKGDIAADVFVH
jgi:hypothetical protein